nr:unnamed protein product [Callosobruchus analis]
MSFKIVQTTEHGSKVLTIVPTTWEKDGISILAPHKAQLIRLIKDGNSRPEPDWVPQPASKKRSNFLSYEAADLELTAMEQKTDSEGSQILEVEVPKKDSHLKRGSK